MPYVNFNTSYVIFYPHWSSCHPSRIPFQYILCYFLSRFLVMLRFSFLISIHPMLFFIGMFQLDEKTGMNFNTSYVIFYRTFLFISIPVSSFQYILCYFLSHGSCVGLAPIWLFQYILCYFLSHLLSRFPQMQGISIHPMLFFILIYNQVNSI